jgi:McrBC 5-methylcytosine restriction system component
VEVIRGSCRIRLIERGPTVPLPEDEVGALQADAHFQKLISNGMLGLRRIGGTLGLQAGKYVGRAILPSVTIEVLPQRPALFASIIGLSTAYNLRQSGAVGIGDNGSPGFTSISDALLKAWSNALHNGLPKVYVSSVHMGTSLRGRIMMSETIRTLVSRGIKHRAVTKVRTPVTVGCLESLLTTVVELLRLRYDSTKRQLILMDTIASYIGECETLPVTEALRICDELEKRYQDWPDLAEAMRASRLFLTGVDIAWTERIESDRGRSTFCDMDRLWELACYHIVEEACDRAGLRAALHPLASARYPLMDVGAKFIDPDIIVYRDADAFSIFDAKYSLSQSASSPDVYQMLAYCRRMNSRLGVLIYLGEANWSEVVGSDGDLTLLAVGVSIAVDSSIIQKTIAVIVDFLHNAMAN